MWCLVCILALSQYTFVKMELKLHERKEQASQNRYVELTWFKSAKLSESEQSNE